MKSRFGLISIVAITVAMLSACGSTPKAPEVAAQPIVVQQPAPPKTYDTTYSVSYHSNSQEAPNPRDWAIAAPGATEYYKQLQTPPQQPVVVYPQQQQQQQQQQYQQPPQQQYQQYQPRSEAQQPQPTLGLNEAPVVQVMPVLPAPQVIYQRPVQYYAPAPGVYPQYQQVVYTRPVNRPPSYYGSNFVNLSYVQPRSY